MRVRVGLARLSMGGPAGVPNPGMALERLADERAIEIVELADGPHDADLRAIVHRKARGIVTAILKLP